jgi:hypothetical protein
LRFLIKILISSVVLAAVSEIAKRSTVWAAVTASLPLTSMLALTWLYLDTTDTQKISDLSIGIFWAVLPSLIFFVALPFALRCGLRFPMAMLSASIVMVAAYIGYAWIMGRVGIRV